MMLVYIVDIFDFGVAFAVFMLFLVYYSLVWLSGGITGFKSDNINLSY